MWLPLRDDRIAAPVRVPMGKTVQRTASSASDRGSCEVLFWSHGERGYSVSQIMLLRDAPLVTVFVGAAGFLVDLSLCNDLPLQCEH